MSRPHATATLRRTERSSAGAVASSRTPRRGLSSATTAAFIMSPDLVRSTWSPHAHEYRTGGHDTGISPLTRGSLSPERGKAGRIAYQVQSTNALIGDEIRR